MLNNTNRLNDIRLEKVNGGIAESGYEEETRKTPKQIMLVACQHCREPFEADVQTGLVRCPHCKKINRFYG